MSVYSGGGPKVGAGGYHNMVMEGPHNTSRGGSPTYTPQGEQGYPTIGDQHPEGPSTSHGAGQPGTPDFGPGRPSSKDGYQGVGGDHESAGPDRYYQYPPSRRGSRPTSQQGPPSRQGQFHPPTQGCAVRPDSQGQGEGPHQYQQADRLVIDQSGGGEQGHDHEPGQGQDLQPLYAENIQVDWPVPRVALERVRYPDLCTVVHVHAPPPAQERPSTQDSQKVPPTPMPPLNWQGYQETNRPTFASWHEQYHQQLDNQHHFTFNSSNSNNVNNNNMDCGVMPLCLVPPRVGVKYNEAVPTSYRPSMVMNWDETEDSYTPSPYSPKKSILEKIQAKGRASRDFACTCLQGLRQKAHQQTLKFRSYRRLENNEEKEHKDRQE